MPSISDEHRKLTRTHSPEEYFPDDRPGRRPIPACKILEAVREHVISPDPALPLVVVTGDYRVTESSLGVTGQIARKIAFVCSG